MFSYLYKVLFSGFLQFKGNFVDGQNNSKYRDVGPFMLVKLQPRSQGLSSYRLGLGGKMRDPGNEVGQVNRNVRANLEKIRNKQSLVKQA